MLELLYASNATERVSEAVLDALLTECRRRNPQIDITGILLYQDGNFIQVLEGEQAAVMQLFAKIERDPRHHGMLVLSERDIEQRSFPGWSMGFRRLQSGADQATEDVFQLTRDALLARIPPQAPHHIATFLRTFYRISGGTSVHETDLQ